MKPKKNFNCSIDGCLNTHKARGYCKTHYYQKYNANEFDIKNLSLRKHPFYHLWFQRKQDGLLCESWLNFENFIWDVGKKPEGNYLFLQIDGTKPFGPDNFRWQEHLKRKKDETSKAWWARKRAARIFANPSMERDRNIKRKYNLTRQQYDEKLKSQNGVCAICEQPESSASSSGGFKNLAVDHNHKTNVIRDLLCWRCNGTIGKLDENLELLDKIKAYLIKHQESN